MVTTVSRDSMAVAKAGTSATSAAVKTATRPAYEEAPSSRIDFHSSPDSAMRSRRANWFSRFDCARSRRSSSLANWPDSSARRFVNACSVCANACRVATSKSAKDSARDIKQLMTILYWGFTTCERGSF